MLQVEDVAKSFGGVRALRGASLAVSRPGAVHGLIGANGSGKSTMLGIVSGQLRPDAGQVYVHGRPVHLASTPAAIAAGIAMVSQETALAPHLSVAENIYLGRLQRTRFGAVSPRLTRAAAEEVLARLGVRWHADRLVSELRPDERQLVEIARAISLDARVLILDEPTSSLTGDEVSGLFGVVRQLSGHGVSTIFVTHRIEETFDIVDEVTVLRDGLTVAAGPIGDFTARSLLRQMTDVDLPETSTPAVSTPADLTPDELALDVRGMHVERAVFDVDLAVRPGEILGLAGLVGAGRSELLEAVFGARPRTSGEVMVSGVPVPDRKPRRAVDLGIGFVPADRKTQGVVLSQSLDANLTMITTLGRSRLTPPNGGANRRASAELIEQLRIATTSGRRLVNTLSGGNQQKVSLGKWLAAAPRVLLLDEPTRGVDIAAKSEIHDLLRAFAGRGAAVVVSSSESAELRELCTRVVVMARGRVVAECPPQDLTEARLVELSGESP